MNLAVIAPCVYPSLGKVHYLHDSCKRYGVDIKFHGVGQPYADWRSMLVRYTLPHMRELLGEGYSHVLYMDGIDSLFVAGTAEIVAKYERTGAPSILFSGDSDIPLSHSENWIGKAPWKYPNAGGYIGILSSIISLWERLSEQNPDEGNYQRWVEQCGFERISIDHDCLIFQNMDGHPSVMPNGCRVLNAVTATYPCILHFRGGYCDPETGRDERMKPWVEALSQ